MRILGINAIFHDPAAAVVVDGEIVAAAEEERFSRRKHGKRPVPFSTWELPEQAAAWCLEEAGLEPEELDAVAYSYDPDLAPTPSDDVMADDWEGLRTLDVERAGGFLRSALPGLDPAQLRHVPHHVAHAASAYLAGPHRDGPVLTIDGRGEVTTHLAGHVRGGDLEVLARTRMPHSLGLLYEELTEHLGFRRSSDEYKIMAMASYGRPRHLERFRELVVTHDDGTFTVEPVDWPAFAKRVDRARARDLPSDEVWTDQHADLAASVQAGLEEAVLELAGWLRRRSGERTLTLAVLLDRDVDGSIERLAPDAPVPVVDEEQVVTRPGGAGLAAVLAAQDGHDVTLLTATGDDAAGDEVRRLLAEAGVEVIDLGTDAPTPEKIRLAPGGRPVARLDRGGRERGRVGALPPAAVRALAAGDGVLVSDYGRGVTASAEVRDALEVAARDLPLVWDPHPRGEAPTAHARLATPNRGEARRFASASATTGDDLRAVTSRAEALADRWPIAGVVVTMGAGGALLLDGGSHPLVVPAPAVRDGDACGAGDRFAVSVAAALADGRVPSRAVTAAVHAATAFVAAGGARSVRVPGPRDPASDGHEPADPVRLAEAVRGRGGTVVATGGCFDLLHAGHVATLQSARSLGDCLIVCLNSDASVRRLKGADRPINDQEDRAAVLRALGCVDAIAVFDEDTPTEVLREVRPHVWAKGGDYAVAGLPEAEVVEAWGGQAVVLPYVEGRSSSRLLEEVRRDAR